MAYIGQGIKNGTFAKLDTSGNTYNGSNVTFALGTQVGSPVQLLVSHDGVIQNPGTDYTLASNGTQITFTTAPASGASIFIMEISGAVGGPMNRDINGEELILDVDGDTSITADTDDQIDIKIAGDDDFTFTASTLTVNSTNKICFNDATQFIQGASGTVLDIAATDEIELNATAIDLNGTLDVSGTSLLTGRVGVVTAGDLGTGIHIRRADSGAGVDTGADDLVIENDNHAGISILTPNNKIGRVFFSDPQDSDVGYINYDHSSNLLEVGVNAATVMNIDSGGKVRINTASDLGNSQGVLHVKGKTNNNIARFGAGTNGEGIVFVNPSNTQVGSITINASATSFDTSSDYRLKENVDYTWDATTRLKQLKPARFNWIVDSNNTLLDGFLAHEVSSVVPEAITGTKDQLEKNEDGTNKLDDDENTIPKHQGIDQSKLVPLLTKALQEAITKIETLETKVKALEDA